MPKHGKRWIIRPLNTDLANALVGTARISPLLANLLVARGVDTDEKIKVFREADFRTGFRKPGQLPGADAVARRLFEAIQNDESIAIYGDYDVDGMTSTAILQKTLQDLGAKKVRHYIPNRLDEGYGLNSDALRELKGKGTDLVVTVDCGITSLDEARLAAEIGLTLLVTDHHIPVAELPQAAAIAHPQLVRFPADGGALVSAASLTSEQLDQAKRYPFPDLCGAGVALKVALRLNEISARETGQNLSDTRICEIIVLAALATIADYVPLLDENRCLVRAGLNLLGAGEISAGLTQLLNIAQGTKQAEINEEFIAFQIQPRLNAAGRLGQAGLAVELLLSNNLNRCKTLAAEIDTLNKMRRETESEIQKAAENQIHKDFDPGDSAFVLTGDWHKGIIGIVANRIMEKYHKPVILVAVNPLSAGDEHFAVGSGRSPSTFDLHEALQACEKHFVRFGGHAAAAGLTLETKNIDAFREDFLRFTERKIAEEERIAELFIDGEFPLGSFTRQTIDEIAELAPFGAGNRPPIFMARGVTVAYPKAMGPRGDHFSAEFSQGKVAIRGIAFGRKNWIEEMQPYTRPLDIVFEAKVGSYSKKPELSIIDWRFSET